MIPYERVHMKKKSIWYLSYGHICRHAILFILHYLILLLSGFYLNFKKLLHCNDIIWFGHYFQSMLWTSASHPQFYSLSALNVSVATTVLFHSRYLSALNVSVATTVLFHSWYLSALNVSVATTVLSHSWYLSALNVSISPTVLFHSWYLSAMRSVGVALSAVNCFNFKHFLIINYSKIILINK